MMLIFYRTNSTQGRQCLPDTSGAVSLGVSTIAILPEDTSLALRINVQYARKSKTDQQGC